MSSQFFYYALLVLITCVTFCTSAQTFSSFASSLWNRPDAKLNPGSDYKIQLRGTVGQSSGKLFTFLNENSVFAKETFSAMKKVLGIYKVSVRDDDVLTPAQIRIQWDFLNAILKTEIMKKTHQYLVSKGKASADSNSFKQKLYNIWFQRYSRSQKDNCPNNDCSSGFEHVFVGEMRGDVCLGLHNWLQFYLQEKAGRIDYEGYYKSSTDYRQGSQARIITNRFTWNEGTTCTKKLGGFLIGVTPELEMALYSTAFLLGNEGKSCIKLNNQLQISMVFYSTKGKVATVYPKLGCSNLYSGKVTDGGNFALRIVGDSFGLVVSLLLVLQVGGF